MRLNCAADDGDLNGIRRLVAAGWDPNKMDYNGQSPLHRAALNGYEDIVRFLIGKRVDINHRDPVASLLVESGALLSIDNAGSVLCEAVARRELDFLKRLLGNGINPNSKNYDLRTPLHLAASEGLYAECALILETGASVFAADRWGRTPLDEARIGGDCNLLKLLQDAKLAQMSEFSDCFQRSQEMQQASNFIFGLKKQWKGLLTLQNKRSKKSFHGESYFIIRELSSKLFSPRLCIQVQKYLIALYDN